ncbi:MAG: Ku protein [Dehalococcoidales bacterium]|nr:Ku protein [Dehalococcoidales bacterium]
MSKAFWKGAITFGMVVIPVRMYTATEDKVLRTHYLHKKCFSKPKQTWYCPVDEEYFTAEDLVRAYEYSEGQYVTLDDSDFKKVPVATTHAIHILGFVESQEIDLTYYRNSYYLEPEELGVRPFRLLAETLRKTKRLGLAKVAFQRREHLCCLRPLDGLIALHTMYYHDEILPWRELVPPEQEITPEEAEMANTLVTAMAMKFTPEEYQDEYRQALQRIIEAKVKGEEVKVPRTPKIAVPDLMSALKASIETAKRESEAKEKLRVWTARERSRQPEKR